MPLASCKKVALLGLLALRFLRPRKLQSLEGKVVLITGASRGIGERLALAFAAQKCKLCLAARKLDELGEVADRCMSLGASDAIAVQCDVSDPAQLKIMVDKCVSQLGNVEILINNAGVEFASHFQNEGIDSLSAVCDINVRAPMILANLVAKPMIEAKNGIICNMSSVAGFVSFPTLSPYCASKSAMIAFTMGLRQEMMPHGVKVFAVCPGMVTEAGMAANFANNYEAEAFSPQMRPMVTRMSTLVKQVVRHVRLQAPNALVVPVPMPVFAVHSLSGLFPDTASSILWNTSPMKAASISIADRRAGAAAESEKPSAPPSTDEVAAETTS